MRLPLGMHLPSILVGVVFALFVYPRLISLFGNVGSRGGEVA